jgi:uncharacterized membrane protein YjjP (DUF1212 family)
VPQTESPEGRPQEVDPETTDHELRRLLLELGAELLGGGLPVNEVEESLRDVGTALGRTRVDVAAFPTGLFVTLATGEATGFRPIADALRFDQTAEVLELARRLREGPATAAEALGALDRIRRARAAWPAWVSDLGTVPIGVGLCLLLQPGYPNLVAAAAGSLIVAALTLLGRLWAPIRPLLPVIASFLVSAMVFLAADAALLDGPLRTIVAVLAVLLPGSLLVTGLSEIAAGAASAGSARLVSGAVQLVLFLTGVLAAAAVVQAPASALSNTPLTPVAWWIPSLGVAVTVAGVIVRFNTPLRATPHIVVVVAVTAAVQLSVQSVYGPALAGLLGAIAAAVAATVAHRLPGGPAWQVVYLPAFWVLVPGSFGLINAAQIRPGNALDALGAAGAALLAVSIGTLIGSLISRLPDGAGRRDRR